MTIDLSQLSEALATTVASVAPAVVRVKGHRRHVASGIVYDDGLVVTSAHALRRRREVAIGLDDDVEAVGTVVSRDHGTDLAVVRVEGAKLHVPPWHDATDLAVGHMVLALGRPGTSIRALWGIIGGLGGPWETALGARVDRYVDVDASLRWGFTGGPLLDTDGRVIGVNSAALTRAGTTLPTATVQRVVQRLLDRPGSTGAYLGIGAHPVPLPPDVAEEVGQDKAALVVAVEPDSPAKKAGILLGDALISVGGARTRTVAQVAAALADRAPGEEVDVVLVRAGAVDTVKAELGSRG